MVPVSFSSTLVNSVAEPVSPDLLDLLRSVRDGNGSDTVAIPPGLDGLAHSHTLITWPMKGPPYGAQLTETGAILLATAEALELERLRVAVWRHTHYVWLAKERYNSWSGPGLTSAANALDESTRQLMVAEAALLAAGGTP